MNKKIATLVAALLILAIASISMSLAYFTDTDAVKNEFTVGDVEIDLTEGAWIRDLDPASPTYGDIIPAVYDENGDKVPAEGVVADRDYVGETATEASVNNYGKLYPGMTVYKDPIIENTGSENAFVAAKITITDGAGDDIDLTKIIGSTVAPGFINLTGFVTGGECGVQMPYDEDGIFGAGANVHYTDTVFVKQIPRGNGVWDIYVFVINPLGGSDDTTGLDKKITLFTNINVSGEWDQAEMANLKDLSIDVKSYATQTSGFATCLEAMKAAFPTDFAAADFAA